MTSIKSYLIILGMTLIGLLIGPQINTAIGDHVVVKQLKAENQDLQNQLTEQVKITNMLLQATFNEAGLVDAPIVCVDDFGIHAIESVEHHCRGVVLTRSSTRSYTAIKF